MLRAETARPQLDLIRLAQQRRPRKHPLALTPCPRPAPARSSARPPGTSSTSGWSSSTCRRT